MIEIIAPAGNVKDPSSLQRVSDFLNTWGYQARFGQHILQSDKSARLDDLKTALYSPDSKIIWCFRGGSGSSELLPDLTLLTPPAVPKIFLGFSDVTSLHIFFTQQWGWTTYHGPGARQPAENEIDAESVHRIKLLLDTHKTRPLPGIQLTGPITGGNLSIISHSLGTPYQLNAAHKHLLLEDTNEPAYKVRRMLTQLSHAGIFKNILSVLIGEFIHKDPEQVKLIQQEFKLLDLPVPLQFLSCIGHGKTNYVVPLG